MTVRLQSVCTPVSFRECRFQPRDMGTMVLVVNYESLHLELEPAKLRSLNQCVIARVQYLQFKFGTSVKCML